VALSPYTGSLRLGGTLELQRPDFALSQPRLDAIVAAARRYLADWPEQEPAMVRTGQRPMLPDSLPAIGGFRGLDGLYVAAGHGMVGITMSVSTGAALAPVVVDGKVEPLLAAFSPERFSLRRSRVATPA
jgi:D-amino-acid dehydrogenase